MVAYERGSFLCGKQSPRSRTTAAHVSPAGLCQQQLSTAAPTTAQERVVKSRHSQYGNSPVIIRGEVKDGRAKWMKLLTAVNSTPTSSGDVYNRIHSASEEELWNYFIH